MFDAQFKGRGHKRLIASGSLDQRPLCNSGVKWSSLVGVHRSEQSCLLIDLPTARSHQLANTGRYCDTQPDAARRRTASIVWCPLTYELLPRNFVAIDCTQFPEILLFGNFFPGNGKFFRDPGKSSPVNIPITNLWWRNYRCFWLNWISFCHIDDDNEIIAVFVKMMINMTTIDKFSSMRRKLWR